MVRTRRQYLRSFVITKVIRIKLVRIPELEKNRAGTNVRSRKTGKKVRVPVCEMPTGTTKTMVRASAHKMLCRTDTKSEHHDPVIEAPAFHKPSENTHRNEPLEQNLNTQKIQPPNREKFLAEMVAKSRQVVL